MLFVFYGVRPRKYGVRRYVPRKDRAVAVEYFSPLGDDGDLPRPLIDRFIAQLGARNDLYIEKTDKNDQKKKGRGDEHRRQPLS